MVWQKGDKSLILGEYSCPNGCGRVITMPGAVTRHLRSCVTSLRQLRVLGGANETPDNQCWLWPGSTSEKRAKLCFTSPITGSVRRRYVYVIAYILTRGVDPETDKLLICHHCDDGRCFNPQCLFMGTNADNQRDMSLKGRAGGFRHMDPDRVREIASIGGIAGGSKGGSAPRRPYTINRKKKNQ